MKQITENIYREKNEMINRILILFTTVITLGLVGSLLRINSIGWHPVMGYHVFLVVCIYGVTYKRTSISLNKKLYFILACFFSGGFAGLVQFGLLSGAVIMFLTAIIIASAMAKRTVSIIFLVLGSALFLTMGVGVYTQWFTFSFDVLLYHNSFTSWALKALIFLLFGYMVTQIIKNMNDIIYGNLERIEWQRKELEKSDALKDKVFSVIAHDLRRPFSGLIGIMQVLSQGNAPIKEEEKELLYKRIFRDSKGVYELLENLLLWSQSQIGTIQLEKEQIEINDLVAASIVPHRLVAENKEITITHERADGLSVFVDKSSIQIVLGNLISNAIKFTPHHGSIIISSIKTPEAVKIKISDSGVGMPPDVIESLFDDGNLRTTLGTDSEKGSGIGLRLCKELVETNKGTITVKSEQDTGSVFTVTLPQDDL